MPKVTVKADQPEAATEAAPKTTTKVLVRAPVASRYDDFVELSWDKPLEDALIILYGQYGAGKSTTALTASKFFPKEGLPTTKHKGAKPKYVLHDMFWFSFDKGATQGFAERGIAVPEFSVVEFMSKEKLWRKAGFGKRPNIRQAVDFGLQLAAVAVSQGAQWFVADTLAAFDKGLENYERDKPGSDDDTRAMFGRMFNGHKAFHDAVRMLGCGVIYCCHAKAIGDVSKMSAEEKKRLITLSSAGMPEFMPDITGKGAGVYKGDASLQLVIHAHEVPGSKGKLERVAYTVMQNKWEAKNRFELSLDPKEEPNIGKMLKKIRGV